MYKKVLGVIKKYLRLFKRNRNTVLFTLLIVIFSDVLLVHFELDVVYFVVIIVAGISMHVYRMQSRIIFYLCIALLFVMGASYVLQGVSKTTEIAAVWVILFWGLGALLQLKETHAP